MLVFAQMTRKLKMWVAKKLLGIGQEITPNVQRNLLPFSGTEDFLLVSILDFFLHKSKFSKTSGKSNVKSLWDHS